MAVFSLLLLIFQLSFEGFDHQSSPQCPVFYHQDHGLPDTCDGTLSPTLQDELSVLPSHVSAPARPAHAEPLADLRAAVGVVRTKYFLREIGTWPEAIDWTAAFTQTVLSGAMSTYAGAEGNMDLEVHALFVDTVASYFGQDTLSIRYEAFDDILWVVLGWIEAINSMTRYQPHFPLIATGHGRPPWHGAEWVPAFAHRARIFWDLAADGWDTKRCGGGMVWDPRLVPYKNSITNELWVAASAAMWLYFPGDNSTSPFTGGSDISGASRANPAALPHVEPIPSKNPAHLEAAMMGYDWLVASGLMNDRGLYIDGFHITNWSTGGATCDLPDTSVYTYNQGVILSGQMHLWRATGRAQYIIDGHRLIQSVIAATGWDLASSQPIDDINIAHPTVDGLPPFHGLGRGGVLEEDCDVAGDCSQDRQAFKGIFFHHFAAFCAPMPSLSELRRDAAWKFHSVRYQKIRKHHAGACRAYTAWAAHNCAAALMTRDASGNAGMWWGANMFTAYSQEKQHHQPQVLQQQDDYSEKDGASSGPRYPLRDPNERGRGRTLETQVGLVALLRAYYELQQMERENSGFWSWVS